MNSLNLSSREKTRETNEYLGHNTSARFTFMRHSQKSSGQVFAKEGGISASGISEAGHKRASQLGATHLKGREVKKGYATKIDRTKETLESAFKGASLDTKILQESDKSNAFFSMPAISASSDFMRQYTALMDPKKQELINERFPGKNFNDLSPNEQEEIAEIAEEPSVEWYLSFDDKRFDPESPSPREHASFVAYKVNRLINLPDYMPNEKSVDLVSSGHKTSTESFLKYTIEREINGEKVVGFDKLSDIGGSLKILDSWDLFVTNNEKGEKQVKVIIRRENGDTQEYGLNLEKVKELAQEFITTNNLEAKKIDSLN